MRLVENQREADAISGLYQDLEERLMQNIARHIKNYDQPIPTDEWHLQKLAEIGRLNKENIKIISEMAGISDTAAQRMLEDMAEKVIRELDPGFQYLARQRLVEAVVPAGKSKNVQCVMRGVQKQARDTLNLCNTTMLYKARDAYKNLVGEMAREAAEISGKQAFMDILNKNATAAIIGGESRAQAVRRCIKAFNEKGIPAFVDKRGHEWTPEAYVNMAMRTTSANVANEVQMARCDDHDISLIEISSHAGARPRCARDQGKIFDRANKSRKYPHWKDSSYGKPDGLFGINCGHHGYPFIEGVSIRRHFPTEDLEANDKLYKEIQMQRGLERDVRKQKRECMLYDTLGDKEAFEEAAVKLKSKEAALNYYVDGNDQLHRRKDREQVAGFDKRISAEAVGTAQEHYRDWSKSIGAESGPKNLAGYYDLKYNETKESRLYNGYVRAVKKGEISPLVGYDNFKETAAKVEKELVGLKTTDGQEVKGITAHLVGRIIGQHSADDAPKEEMRQGVRIEDVKKTVERGTVEKPVIRKDGRRSQRIIGETCIVTINPETQELIQTNPGR